MTVKAIDGYELNPNDYGDIKEYLFEKMVITSTGLVPHCGESRGYLDILIEFPEFIQMFDGSFTIDLKNY